MKFCKVCYGALAGILASSGGIVWVCVYTASCPDFVPLEHELGVRPLLLLCATNDHLGALDGNSHVGGRFLNLVVCFVQ